MMLFVSGFQMRYSGMVIAGGVSIIEVSSLVIEKNNINIDQVVQCL
jgi:hypothetical protein